MIYIGTAGWSIPRTFADTCEREGTHLERYSRLFNCAEINSSFYRPHLPRTYARWRACTPDGFRFALKVPKRITHELKLQDGRDAFAEFLTQSAPLEEKRGPLLVQLPPSLAFHPKVVRKFWLMVRDLYSGPLVCEPRHPSWWTTEAERLLKKVDVARAAADPAVVPAAAEPGGASSLVYVRLHGSPRMYWSRYAMEHIQSLAERLSAVTHGADVWCVFDNTAAGAAIENAWELQRRYGPCSL